MHTNCASCGRAFPASEMTYVEREYYCGECADTAAEGRAAAPPQTGGAAIASLFFGAAAVLLFWVPGVNIVSSLLAVLFGIADINPASESRAGTIMGWTGLGLGLLGLLLFGSAALGIIQAITRGVQSGILFR